MLGTERLDLSKKRMVSKIDHQPSESYFTLVILLLLSVRLFDQRFVVGPPKSTLYLFLDNRVNASPIIEP